MSDQSGSYYCTINFLCIQTTKEAFFQAQQAFKAILDLEDKVKVSQNRASSLGRLLDDAYGYEPGANIRNMVIESPSISGPYLYLSL